MMGVKHQHMEFQPNDGLHLNIKFYEIHSNNILDSRDSRGAQIEVTSANLWENVSQTQREVKCEIVNKHTYFLRSY